MYELRIKRRITAALAVAILVGSGALVATPAAATGTTPPEATTAVAALPRGKVIARLPLSIRQRPTTNSAYLGSFQPGTIITLYCKTRGQNVEGNNLWYLLGGSKRGWVSARFVKNFSPVAYCRF